MTDLTGYLCPTKFDVGDFHIEKILPTLTPEQIKYATYLSLASWAGFPMVASQVSRETPAIHEFWVEFFSSYPRPALEAAVAQPSTPLCYLLEFAATFYNNAGNYLGFGDTKLLPRITRDELTSLVAGYPSIKAKLDVCIDSIYSTDPSCLNIGYYPGNVTPYYEPGDFTEAEVDGVNAIFTSQVPPIQLENTIVYRHDDRYEVRRFSINVDTVGQKVGEYGGKPVVLTSGAFSGVLTKVVHWLSLARDSALNPGQKDMLDALIKHYQTGDVRDHVRYSELWVDDVDPAVEHYHGFIETYRDPSGLRAEFEGMVAALDTVNSDLLHKFTDAAATILPLLPYPPVYERKNFVAPSFNAINIITFCVTGCPLGINIPNYDEVRLGKGFKNVSLTNILNAVPPDASKYPFLTADVIPMLVKHQPDVKALGIAAHELYGHGSGTLFNEADVAGNQVPDLLFPGRFVTTFYKEGETVQKVFGSVNASFEECRAETTALHLAFKEPVLELFGVPPEIRETFKLCSVLEMLHTAVKQLNCYAPEVLQWKQAHARARFAILRAVLMWGRGAVVVKKTDDAACPFKLIVDPKKFDGIVDAIELLLKHLNYYKAARLPEQAKEFYGALTSVDDFWMQVRAEAIRLLSPRPVHTGTVIRKVDGGYTLARGGGETLTTLDVALTALENIRVALE
jgi:dipeptidyl-peptidase-3